LTQRIRLERDEARSAIRIGTEGCDPVFVARLRAELGAQAGGGFDASAIQVPVARFLASREVLSAVCRQYGVGLDADDETAALLRSVIADRDLLEQIRDSHPSLSDDQTLQRLSGTRFVRSLRPFQTRDLGRLLALPHGANFSVPGAGKTTVAYACYEAERAAERVDRLLVVGPLSSFDAWTTEPIECFDEPPVIYRYEMSHTIPTRAEVVVVNYSKLLNPDCFSEITGWLDEGRSHVILDEVHRIKKGRAGAWGTACLDLAWHAVRRDILTGTPAPQHPSDLEALLDFLWPAQARTILPPDTFERHPLPDIGRQLAEALAPIHVRTRKSELGLDEPQHTVLRLELQGLQREIYKAITNQYSGSIPASRRDRTRLAQMRTIVMYLLEAATNPALLALGSSPDDPPVFEHPRAPIPAGSGLIELLNQYGRYETPAKFRKLGELVRGNAEQGRKTLVWSNFVRNLELLRRDLGRYQPAVIHGGVPSETSQPSAPTTREMELSRFRSDDACMVLLANPAAMSEGVSLHHTCHDAIYLERTFNAGQYLQSVDRIHRLGLAPGTTTRITFLVSADTIDEVVHDRIQEKAARLGAMLSDPDILTMALPDDGDLQDVDSGFGQALDDDADVEALFEHLRGDDAD